MKKIKTLKRFYVLALLVCFGISQGWAETMPLTPNEDGKWVIKDGDEEIVELTLSGGTYNNGNGGYYTLAYNSNYSLSWVNKKNNNYIFTITNFKIASLITSLTTIGNASIVFSYGNNNVTNSKKHTSLEFWASMDNVNLPVNTAGADGNINIKTSNSRSFTFYLGTIEVTYDLIKVENLTYVAHDGNDYYATFSSSDVTFWPNTSATVYAASSDGSSLTLAESFESGNIDIANSSVSGHFVPAETGVLLKKDNGGNVPYYIIKGKTPTTPTGNMLHPASEQMSGDYLFYKLAYNKYSSQEGLGFYWGAENGGSFNCKAGTAYLAIPNGTNAKLSFTFEDDVVDGINNVEFKNSRIQETAIYNLAGQRVENLVRGQIYIKNGKKFIAK